MIIKILEAKYSKEALNVDYFDGLCCEFKNWRFNLKVQIPKILSG